MLIENQHQAKVATWTFQYNKEDFVIFKDGLLCYSNQWQQKVVPNTFTLEYYTPLKPFQLWLFC
jgi:hypothetical protein